MSDPEHSPTAFAQLACGSCPALDHFLLALAAEFRPVDPAGALLALDRLALDVGLAQQLAPADQLDALAGALMDLRPRPADGVEAIALDRVLATGTGHPIMLAAIHVLVARRSAIPMGVLLAGGRPLVGHMLAGEVLVLDPAAGARRVPGDALPAGARWRCPHQVAYGALTSLAGASLERGDVRLAVHAAELRLQLPCDVDSRLVLEREVSRLRARLDD